MKGVISHEITLHTGVVLDKNQKKLSDLIFEISLHMTFKMTSQYKCVPSRLDFGDRKYVCNQIMNSLPAHHRQLFNAITVLLNKTFNASRQLGQARQKLVSFFGVIFCFLFSSGRSLRQFF
jgi:hypothetical protein